MKTESDCAHLVSGLFITAALSLVVTGCGRVDDSSTGEAAATSTTPPAITSTSPAGSTTGIAVKAATPPALTPPAKLAASNSHIPAITARTKDVAGNTKKTGKTLPFNTDTATNPIPPAVSSTSSDKSAAGVAEHGAVNSITSNNTKALTTATAQPATASTDNGTGNASIQCNQTDSNVAVACDNAGALTPNNAQDSAVGRDAKAVTNSSPDSKKDFRLASVPAAGPDSGGCVHDKATGLMWEVKTADGSLRDRSKTYTNYSPNYNPRRLYGATTDASGFVAAVNFRKLCGHSDWRLPTADELKSIPDNGDAFPGPTIDPTWFPKARKVMFWSASGYTGDSHNAWFVYFLNGSISYVELRDASHNVRLVRNSTESKPSQEAQWASLMSLF